MRAMWKSSFAGSLALAVASAAAPAIAAECGSLTVLSTLELTTERGIRPIVPAMIGDAPVNLLVDTGAPYSVVTRRTVRELNLQTASSGVQLRTINGAAANAEVRLPSITLGRIKQEGLFFMLLPGTDDPTDTRPPLFHGILGADFLQRVDLDFDFAAHKLNIISQNHCAGKVVYWTAPKVAIVPMTLDRTGHIALRMELDGKRVNAMLDTGATTTALNLTTARQAFNIDVNAPDVEKTGELVGNYTSSVYRRRFKTLAFEGVVINNPMIYLIPDMMSGQNPGPSPTGSIIREDRALPDVILGMAELNQLHVFISYAEKKVYISNSGAPAPAAPAQ